MLTIKTKQLKILTFEKELKKNIGGSDYIIGSKDNLKQYNQPWMVKLLVWKVYTSF